MPGSGRRDRATSVSNELANLFQFGQVIANRHGGNAKGPRQSRDVRRAVALHELGYLSAPVLGHGRPGGLATAWDALSFSYVFFHPTGILPVFGEVKSEATNNFKILL